jgi:hypothetical protein
LIGGTGDVSYAACMAYPHMKIKVFDQPSIVENSPHFRPSMDECPNQQNVTFEAGDFFEPTLPPADLYVLTHILHCWTQDKVDVLLSNAFNNLPSGTDLTYCTEIICPIYSKIPRIRTWVLRTY